MGCRYLIGHFEEASQLTFTCSKLTIETSERQKSIVDKSLQFFSSTEFTNLRLFLLIFAVQTIQKTICFQMKRNLIGSSGQKQMFKFTNENLHLYLRIFFLFPFFLLKRLVSLHFQKQRLLIMRTPAFMLSYTNGLYG